MAREGALHIVEARAKGGCRDPCTAGRKWPQRSVQLGDGYQGQTSGSTHSGQRSWRSTMTTQVIDEAKAAAFAGQMVGILNGATLTFMTSIGHHTGLFDTMADLPPATSERIAEATGLNER